MRNHRSKRGDVPSLAQLYNVRSAELAAEGKDVIKMHLGQPSTPIPSKAFEAMAKVNANDLSTYSSGVGIEALRERIALSYQENYGVEVDKERIVITIGASGALLLALISCFDAGDKIGMPYPVYPAYLQAMKMLGLEVVPIHTSYENNFQLSVNQLKDIDEKLDGLIIASPSNPAGSILPSEQLEAIAQFCEKKKIQLISDEIYHGLVYPGAPELATAIEYSDQAIIMNSFSKYYSMPGWRVGWMVLPEDLLERVSNEARNLYLAPPTPSQYAALAVMDCRDELDSYIEQYQINRELLLKNLPDAGFDRFCAPDGAFYLYMHIEHLHHDSKTFCMDMLNETYVTSMPGTSFDPHHGHHFIRLSYAGSQQDVEQAIERITKWRKQS